MSNTLKIDKLIEEYGLAGDVKTSNVPMTKDFLITAKDISEGGAGTPLEAGNRYCSLVGSLLLLSKHHATGHCIVRGHTV